MAKVQMLFPATNPSPDLLRLVKAPEQDTLSPKERAVRFLLSAH